MQKAFPSLHKPSTKQGIPVFYCGPILQVNTVVPCVQNLAVAGHVWQVVALTMKTFLYKIIPLHGIPVLKTRWSLTAEIVKSKFSFNKWFVCTNC